jgi:hypothetical protein
MFLIAQHSSGGVMCIHLVWMRVKRLSAARTKCSFSAKATNIEGDAVPCGQPARNQQPMLSIENSGNNLFPID